MVAGGDDPDGLRYYQRRAYAATIRHLGMVRGTLGVLFTGAGKTTVAGAVAKHWPGRVLWLAHRDFLISQARSRMSEMTREYISIEKAEFHSDDSRIVVASVQTLKGKRLAKFPRNAFALIIVDEAHHAVADGYRAIFEHFETAKIFGITATPGRADKVGAWNVFDSEAFRLDITWGIKNGFFCPIVPIRKPIEDIDISHIKSVRGDLKLNDIEAEIVKAAAAIAQVTAETMGDRPTIIYTPGVASAHAVAATLREMGKTAESVDQDTPPEKRRGVLASFGKTLQYIVNCAIYTEGLDVPNARGICIARLTESEGLYIQMAGRGGRPEGWIGQLPTAQERVDAIAKSGKPNFILLDIAAGKKGKHDIVSSVETLAGKIAPDIKKRVEKIIEKKNGTVTLTEAVSMAVLEAEEDERRKHARLAKAAMQVKVRTKAINWNPLARVGIDEGDVRSQLPSRTSSPASGADLLWLKANKLPTENATSALVKILKRKAREWYSKNMASFRQRSLLSFVGAPVNVSFAKASELISAWKDAGGDNVKLSPDTIARVMGRDAGR